MESIVLQLLLRLLLQLLLLLLLLLHLHPEYSIQQVSVFYKTESELLSNQDQTVFYQQTILLYTEY